MLQYAHLWNGAGEKECVANYNETDVSFPLSQLQVQRI